MTNVRNNRRQSDPEGVDYSRDRMPVVDPSENVKALSEAANKRQDDLRGYLERLIEQHFAMLEKSVHDRFGEVKDLLAVHQAADQDSFAAIRREMSQHNTDDDKQHLSLSATNTERMTAMRDLLTASIAGVNASNTEVKANVDALTKTVQLNQTNSVSMDTYNEFKRGVETREKVFNDYMLSNQGERSGVKNFWGQIIAAAIGGAALVSMIQFVSSHIK